MARARRTPGQGRPPGRPRPPSPARIHNDWLRLIEVSGPFLSIPAMIRAFPQGLPRDESTSQLRKDFRVQLEVWEEGRRDPGAHQAFVRFVLERVLEWPTAQLKTGQALPPGLAHQVAEHGETLRPDFAVVNPAGHTGAGKGRVLVLAFPPDQGLERAVEGHRWKASPATRAMELCHAVEVPLALVTNGAEWTLVHGKRGETTTYATFNAPLFVEEPGLFDAFRALLGLQRLFGVADADTLEALLAESAANQQEVTDQLGLQVREAVEVLVQAIDRADRDARGAILRDVPEKTLYEAAVGVMMRLVFALAAEERKLLPYGDPLYDTHYSVSTLLAQLQAVADNGEELLERRFAAWARLLASFRAIHGGVDHDRLRLPAYGGSLFDPDRFPFLEGRAPGTRWRETPAKPVQVSDRTVYHLLRALQVLELPVPGGGREARKLSFRALDVEQIGHVYEGLLDHTAVRATEPMLGLVGAKGEEPEVALSDVVMAHERGEDYLVEYLVEKTQKSEASLRRAIAAAGEADLQATARLLQACGNNEKLRDIVAPWARLLRTDSSDFPIVIQKGSVFVTAGADRRSTGTHYTPRSLTEPVVQYALEPQVYRGPAEGWPREKWQLRTPRELLALRVCDMAMGSGAFLAQACRWLGDKLVESWEEAEANAGGKLVVTPEGDLATGAPEERPLPKSTEERIALARRAVAERCLYGVDVNPMAVEIAKLSLWLVTLQKDRPFTFVDHALRCGDSLLGVTSAKQVAHFHLDPERGGAIHHNLFNWTAACEPALKAALEKRRRLESFTVESARDAEEKAGLLADAESALADTRLIADAVVAAALASSDRGNTAYEGHLKPLASLAGTMLDSGAQASIRAAAKAELRGKVDRLLNDGKPTSVARRRPFHWILEFPEVFGAGSSPLLFDSLVGNPPFLAASSISSAFGPDYRRFLLVHTKEATDRGDLSAYFLRRASDLARRVSLITTAGLRMGASSQMGLAFLLERGWHIWEAHSERPWPGSAAVLIIRTVIEQLKPLAPVLDGVQVETISASIEAIEQAARPYVLGRQPLVAGLGFKPYGEGFIVSAKEAQDLLQANLRYKEVVRPFLDGRDLMGRPESDATRWAIFFSDRSLAESEKFQEPLQILRTRVWPARSTDSDEHRKKYWWQFERASKEIVEASRGLKWMFARPKHADIHALARISSDTIPSEALVVFATDDWRHFAVLQSAMHETWARARGSAIKSDMRYTPSSCFETFPFPVIREGSIGQELYEARQDIMRKEGLGLTEIYGWSNSRDVPDKKLGGLRSIHARLDAAVASSYGWLDLDLGHDFHETKQGIRFTISEAARREVLARLLKLNHERYAEEVKEGLHAEGKKKARAKPVAAAQGSLFGGEPARPAAKPTGRN